MDSIQTIKNRYGIIGTSRALIAAIEKSLHVAGTDLSVLITGESGVGKENFPKIIHDNSPRKHSKYIAVNCGAIPEGTIDSELFGHEKGAFTGAIDSRKGYFEEADGGTIFLDEVAELPITTQARLLRVLQSGEFIRVGSSKAQNTNVRVIAATNANLAQAMQRGTFRQDLFFRLNTIPIHIPPLRERKEDIELLFRKFSSDICTQYGKRPITLDEKAKSLLLNYSWPGNVRQLKNVAEQIATMEEGKLIDSEIIKMYLGDFGNEELPVLHTPTRGNSGGFSSSTERDILYQLLFDLKGEVAELKAMMKTFKHGESSVSPEIHQTATTISAKAEEIPTWSEAEEILEETEEQAPMTKDEMLRRQIVKALEKNGGNRSKAAKELFVSERTLYRNIKRLGIK